MKLFFNFIKLKKYSVILFLACLIIFSVSFVLYRIPIKALIYPVFLCVITGIIITAVEFIRYKQKHDKLSEIKNMTAKMILSLPEYESEFENEYQQIIFAMRDETVRLENDFTEKYNDMTDYYSVWAHQIKTPIASMKLTLQGEDSRVSRKLMSELLRIEQYVEMVLAFIRLDSSSTDYVFREYSIDDIIRQCLRKFAPDFIGRKIRLEYNPVNEIIVTDEKWLSFVIEQILSNSLKYTKDGSVKIYKTPEKLLCIEDTGIGIAQEDLPRIFEKGYTGFNGRTDKSASGIGLYLCRRICDILGLGIKAESEAGQGTKIIIDLNQKKIKHE